MPSSINSLVFISIILFKDAILGFGNFLPVIFFITSLVFSPETLITATPDIPGPDDRA